MPVFRITMLQFDTDEDCDAYMAEADRQLEGVSPEAQARLRNSVEVYLQEDTPEDAARLFSTHVRHQTTFALAPEKR